MFSCDRQKEDMINIGLLLWDVINKAEAVSG